MIEENIDTLISRLDITLMLLAGTLMLLLVFLIILAGISRRGGHKRLNYSTKVKKEFEYTSRIIPETPSEKDSILKRFIETVESSLDSSNLTIEQVARNLGTSRAQLFRKIKAESGRTPNDLIKEIRLRKADILLKSTSLSVSEIAYAVGFSSPSYFSKCYKKQFGTVPSQTKA